MNCLCDRAIDGLKNTHFMGRPIELSIIGEGDDKGIVILDRGLVLATFDVKFCPVCGYKLS